MPIRLNLRSQAAKRSAQQAIFKATQEVFQLDIVPAAKQGSPVLTGHNRRTIDADVTQKENGAKALLYTQSGYGGYLELGTSQMKAQPYLWPAFQQFIGNIRKRARSLIGRG